MTRYCLCVGEFCFRVEAARICSLGKAVPTHSFSQVSNYCSLILFSVKLEFTGIDFDISNLQS